KKDAGFPKSIFLTVPNPDWSTRCKAYSPDSSEKNAIHLPSGDQDGSRSAAAAVRVKFRVLPFSAGTVKISPRASKTARAPPGEIAAAVILSATFSKWGRVAGKSPAM